MRGYSKLEKKVVVSLVSRYGLTGAKNALQKLSNISMPTLGKFASEAQIELHRGRPSAESTVIKTSKPAPKKPAKKVKVVAVDGVKVDKRVSFTDEQKAEFTSLIKDNGLTGTQRILAERGTVVSLGTLQILAKNASIELHRGRPAAEKVAAA